MHCSCVHRHFPELHTDLFFATTTHVAAPIFVLSCLLVLYATLCGAAVQSLRFIAAYATAQAQAVLSALVLINEAADPAQMLRNVASYLCDVIRARTAPAAQLLRYAWLAARPPRVRLLKYGWTAPPMTATASIVASMSLTCC